MSDLKSLILQAAIADSWMLPSSDRQLTFEPSLLTTKKGTLVAYQNGFELIALPSTGRAYVLYTMNQVAPNTFGIDESLYGWHKVSDVCTREDMFIDLTINNRHVSKSTSYITRTKFKHTVLAIDVTDNRELLAMDEPLMARFYSSAWLSTLEGVPNPGVKSYGKRIETNSDLTDVLMQYNADKTSGLSFLYHNGWYVDSITPEEVNTGDVLEYIIDYSGEYSFDVSVDDLDGFDSVLDTRRKYLIQQPDNGRPGIDYFDDLEFYLCTTNPLGAGERTHGVKYTFVNFRDIRQLTHKDYALDALRVAGIVSEHDEKLSPSRFFIRIFIRRGKTINNIIKDGNYVDDLYIFNAEKRKLFMLGSASAIDEWKAVNLEKSQWAKWMHLNAGDIGYESLKNVYSHHGVIELLERPIKDGDKYIMPPIMQRGGLVIKFNSDREMVGTEILTTGVTHYELGEDVSYIQCIPGKAMVNARSSEKSSSEKNDPAGYYAEDLYYQSLDGVWNLAKPGTDYYYDVVKNEYNWDPGLNGKTKLKRDSGWWWERTFTMNVRDLGKLQRIFPDVNDNPAITHKFGRLDVYVNRRKIINGFGYQYRWPEFRIYDSEYITGETFEVTIICHGLESDARSSKVGFVKHGLLNYNRHYDLSFNRNYHLNVDGKYADMDIVKFSELSDGFSALPNPDDDVEVIFREGAPYEVLMPLAHVPQIEMYQLTNTQAEAKAKEKQIENFLQQNVPEKEIDDTITIPRQHTIVSLLLVRLLEDFRNNILEIDFEDMTAPAVAAKVSSYEDERSNDIGIDDDLEWHYVVLAAHGHTGKQRIPVRLYNFLKKVNELYLGNRCIINNYFTIE